MDALDRLRLNIINTMFRVTESRPTFRITINKLYGKDGDEQLSYLWKNGMLSVSSWNVVSITRKGLILERELREKEAFK
jgi:predicted DNA-binding ArsR family transcriptional regulator